MEKEMFEMFLKFMFKDSNQDMEDNRNGTIQIVVLQRGFVVVGIFNRIGENVKISRCQLIRKWGSKHGLGEIAISGPTEKTILDPIGLCQFHILGIVFTINCENDKWREIC
jgi:hypothetical protein